LAIKPIYKRRVYPLENNYGDDEMYCKFKMILNLNDPSKIEDTSWIKPMKYVGIWWEMHVGNRLDFAGSQNKTF
jgi:hypothetical protein